MQPQQFIYSPVSQNIFNLMKQDTIISNRMVYT